MLILVSESLGESGSGTGSVKSILLTTTPTSPHKMLATKTITLPFWLAVPWVPASTKSTLRPLVSRVCCQETSMEISPFFGCPLFFHKQYYIIIALVEWKYYKYATINMVYWFITWFDKILQFDWLRGVVLIPNSGISSAREWYFKITIATTIFDREKLTMLYNFFSNFKISSSLNQFFKR